MIGTYFIYNSILIFSTLFVWLSEKTKNANARLILLFVAFLIVFIPAAIRYNIGADYFAYTDIYNSYKLGSDIKQEIGYQFLLDILIFFDLPSHSFFVLSSFIIYFILFLSYPKEGAYYYHFAYMVVFYLVSYNLVRTAIVLSLCLLFFKYYLENKSKIIQLMILLAALSFHKTAVLILVPLILIWMKIDKVFQYRWFTFAFIATTFVIFFLRADLINIVLNSGIVELVGYGHYIHSAYFKLTEFNSGLGILLKVSLLFLALYYSRFIAEKYRALVVASSIVLIYAIIMQSSIEIFSRLQRFYIFGFIFAILGFYLSYRYKFRKIIIAFAVSWGLLFFEMDINQMKSDVCAGSRVSPYVSIFNMQDDKSWSGIPHSRCINW